MTQGIKALRKIQIAQELTAGSTTDTPTAIWRGMGVLTDVRETVFSEETVGYLGGTTRSFVPKTGSEMTIEGDATFEQLGYGMLSGIHYVLPTTDTGSGYIWTWNAQSVSTDLVATSDLQTLTIEAGDNNEAEVAHYLFTKEISFSGAAGEALQNSFAMEGREVTGGQTFTAGIALPNVETILVSKATLFIDPTSDTIGTTQVSQTLLGIELSYATGWQAVYAADGRIDFSFVKRVDDEISCQLTFEHNATATAEKAAWRNQTERAIRIKFEGGALSSAGAYTYKTFIIDLWGKWESFDSLGDQDGNDTVTGTFRARYSPTADAKARFTLVNELAVMP